MPAERIVTLLPSATEIVCGLGLGERVVGVTHECDYPPEIVGRPAVTRSRIGKGLSSGEIDLQVRESLKDSAAPDSAALYHLDAPLMVRLAPDLIVTQALCDVCAVSAGEVHRVAAGLAHPPKVVNLEPMSLADVFETILLVGEAADVPERAASYVASLRARVERVRTRVAARTTPRPRITMLEWIDPLFNAGHWTPELVDLAGGIDCLGALHAPSHEIQFAALQAADPDIIVIALCGFDEARAREDVALLARHEGYADLSAVRAGRVHVVDGNAYFSRSGPRLVDSLELLADLIWCAQDGASGQAEIVPSITSSVPLT